MKTHKRTTVRLILVMAAVFPAAHAQATANSVSFRVERGDTFTNLFGPDWEKAYRQNKTIVMRGGRPVMSPDILLEGSILTVTGDVWLDARASARVATLDQRRAALVARLTALDPNLASPQVPMAADCRRMLANNIGFAANLGFAEAEIAHLERLVQGQSTPQQRGTHISTNWIVVSWCVLAIVLAIAIFRKRQKPVYPEGAVRYHDAMTDLRDAFEGVNRL